MNHVEFLLVLTLFYMTIQFITLEYGGEGPQITWPPATLSNLLHSLHQLRYISAQGWSSWGAALYLSMVGHAA